MRHHCPRFVCFFFSAYVCVLCACLVQAMSKRVSDPLELALWIAVSYHVGEPNPGPLQQQQVLLLTEPSPSWCLAFCVVTVNSVNVLQSLCFLAHLPFTALWRVLTGRAKVHTGDSFAGWSQPSLKPLGKFPLGIPWSVLPTSH